MIPQFTSEASFNDLLEPAMDIADRGDREEAVRYVDGYVEHLVTTFDRSQEEAHDIVESNVGYYAGYFGEKTRRAVKEIFGYSHPVLGDRYKLTQEELFDAGFLYMQGITPS